MKPDRMHLPEIEAQVTHLLRSHWVSLGEACIDKALRHPGVYVLAFSEQSLERRRVSVKDIFYVGMSNARHGVQSRLKHFRDGVERNGLHSAAMRFFREHGKDMPFSKLQTKMRFYAATYVLQCERSNPDDWRDMGHVACLEYYAIARVLAATGRVPPLNLAKERPPLL